MSVALPLALGFLFGWLLERAGLTRRDRVVGAFRFTDLAMLKFLGAALVVGAVGLQALRSLGFVAALPVVPTNLAADAIGGALLGMAMAAAGFCPGTIVAGAGTGRLDYLIPGGLGLLAGALIFGWTAPSFMPALARAGALGPATIPRLFGVSGWLVVVLLTEVALIAGYAAERHAGRRRGASRAHVPAAGARSPSRPVAPTAARSRS
jgi:uncharacterized protein